MAHSIHVGQEFEDYQAFESAIERYQSSESVQFYKRDSRTVRKAQLRVQIKALKVLMEDDPEDFFSYNDIALNSKTLVPLQGGSLVSMSHS